MEFYHTILDVHLKEKKKRIYLLSLDNTEEEATTIINAYMERKPFTFEGNVVHPLNLYQLNILRSEKPSTKLVLPNKKTVSEYKKSECTPLGCCKHRYIGRCLIQGKVEDVVDCTEEYISHQ